jgi:hypothetical protein
VFVDGITHAKISHPFGHLGVDPLDDLFGGQRAAALDHFADVGFPYRLATND